MTELDLDYAALMLMEILYERGLVNRETMEAARKEAQDDRCLPLSRSVKPVILKYPKRI